MSQVSFNSSTGLFTFNTINTQGKVTDSKQLTFQEAVIQMGISSLELQDTMFAKEFQEAQERVSQMTKLNDVMQMLNVYKNSFDKDGKVVNASPGTKINDTQVKMSVADQEKWKKEYAPTFIVTGLIDDGSSKNTSNNGVGLDCVISYKDLTTTLENAKTYQSNLASLNEQQMLKTNQAASRRSTVLQQLQTLLGAVKEGLQAAAR